MRPLFRRDPWCSTPGRHSERGIADLTIAAVVLAVVLVTCGVNSSEVEDVIKWFKTLNDIFLSNF